MCNEIARAKLFRVCAMGLAVFITVLSFPGCSGVEARFERAEDMVAQMRVQNAVERYREDHGTAPADLTLLVPDYLTELPSAFRNSADLAYEPMEGEVRLAPAHGFRTESGAIPMMIEQDDLNLDRVAVALDSYRAMFGSYPAALAELSPRFIDEIPTVAVTGEPYRYFSETGEVYHPEELVRAIDEEEIVVEAPPQTSLTVDDLLKKGTANPQEVLEAGEGLVRQYERLMDDLEL